MEQNNSPLYIYGTHEKAEDAIRALSRSGFDMKRLSLIGKGYHSEELPIGFYTSGDRIVAWGRQGAFWGAIWGLLFAPAVFLLPGLGLVAMAGPVAAALVAALEGAAVVGGTSALAAALSQLGLPAEEVIKYESALKVDEYVLMVHGNAAELAKANYVLTGATIAGALAEKTPEASPQVPAGAIAA